MVLSIMILFILTRHIITTHISPIIIYGEPWLEWTSLMFYGVVNKRVDAKKDANKSIFNRKKTMPPTLFNIIGKANCGVLVVSYNNESWVKPEQIFSAIKNRFDDSLVLSFDYKRYVDAQIGIYNNKGEIAGQVSHLKNKEYLFVGCDRETGEALRNDSAINQSVSPIL